MYRKYYSEYEKRAEEMRRNLPDFEGKSVEVKAPAAIKEPKSLPLPFPISNFRSDDILLLALIFFLMREKNNDKMIILALLFIFISGF